MLFWDKYLFWNGEYDYSASDSRMNTRLQFAQKRQHCVVLGTAVLCFLLF